jgi:hypothetical protein
MYLDNTEYTVVVKQNTTRTKKQKTKNMQIAAQHSTAKQRRWYAKMQSKECNFVVSIDRSI